MADILKGAEQKRDYLSQVFERSVIEDAMRRYISEKSPFSLVLIDVDNFKHVNDSYGHSVGDKVITFMAGKLFEGAGEDAAVGRFGGDEFILLVPGELDYDQIWHFCRRMFSVIEGSSIPNYPEIIPTITLGLSRYPLDGDTYEILFEKADKALYRGKTKGRGCFIIYLEEKHRDIQILSSNKTAVNSVQVHNQVFKLLTRKPNLSETIPSVIKLLSTNLMIDHIGLQGKKKLLFSEIYPISKVKEFRFIENNLVTPWISESMGVFFVNDTNRRNISNQEGLIAAATSQKIGSFCFAEVRYGKKLYGYLRADTVDKCIWQNSTMDLLVTVAKTIAILLHMNKLEIDDLDS